MVNTTRYIELERLGILEISGDQSAEFLQGQLSCDVREVTSTQSRLGVHCNEKGRVLATFYLFYRSPHYYLLLPYSMVSFLLKDLNKYARFYKVKLEDKSKYFQTVGFVGSNITQDLLNYTSLFKLEKNEVYTDHSITLLSISGTIPRAILLSLDTKLNFEKLIPREPFAHWDMVDIKSGIPQVYPESRGVFTPHQLGYNKKGGISFTKGCYTGQEVIARMEYLGKSKQKVYQFDLAKTTKFIPGLDIVDEKLNAQGILIMISSLDALNCKALGVIQNNAIAEKLYCKDVLLQGIEQLED